MKPTKSSVIRRRRKTMINLVLPKQILSEDDKDNEVQDNHHDLMIFFHNSDETDDEETPLDKGGRGDFLDSNSISVTSSGEWDEVVGNKNVDRKMLNNHRKKSKKISMLQKHSKFLLWIFSSIQQLL